MILAGPTACGKTAAAVTLAEELGGEIVSADSMQVYRGMDIGTAKPSLPERRGVSHHMLDVADPAEHYDAGRYSREAALCIEDVFSRGKLPIVCGGTGLYLEALTRGLAEIPDCPRLDHGEDAYRLLCEADPVTARRLEENDTRRIFRALDVWRATGIPLSRYHELQPEPRYTPVCVGIGFEREELYLRIERRTDEMLAAGWLEETRSLLERGGADASSAPMQAIGYRELARVCAGSLSLPDAAYEIKTRTRRYAKRQTTWFLRREKVNWLPGSNTFTHLTKTVEKIRRL
jgi:tRNA dimethylallyltransferase